MRAGVDGTDLRLRHDRADPIKAKGETASVVGGLFDISRAARVASILPVVYLIPLLILRVGRRASREGGHNDNLKKEEGDPLKALLSAPLGKKKTRSSVLSEDSARIQDTRFFETTNK